MSRNVSINEMGDAIMEELEKYSKLATDDMKAAVKETAASVRKDIQAGAPVDTGKYKKSWSVKNMHEDSQSIDLVVHLPIRCASQLRSAAFPEAMPDTGQITGRSASCSALAMHGLTSPTSALMLPSRTAQLRSMEGSAGRTPHGIRNFRCLR